MINEAFFEILQTLLSMWEDIVQETQNSFVAIHILLFFLFFFFPVASGPGTPDSIEGVSQHLSPESSRKAYCRTWEQPCQSASFTHMAQSPNVFNEHNANSSMSPGTAAHNLKSPAVTRSRSVSDSSVPQRG